MYSFGQLLDLITSKLSFPYAILFLLVIIFISVLVKLYYKHNSKKIDQWIDFNYKNIIRVLIIISSIVIFASSLFFVYDNYLYPEPPEDHFRVAISPFYLEGSDEADFATAEDIKNKIESTPENRIKAIILDIPPIKDKEDAIKKGKKAGAHLAVYGGGKENNRAGDSNRILYGSNLF